MKPGSDDYTHALELNRNLEQLGIERRWSEGNDWREFTHLWTEIMVLLTRSELERRDQ